MNFEQVLGIKLTPFIAGLIGGLVSLTYEQNLSPQRALVLVLTGGVTAGYSFTALEYHWALHPTTMGVASFGLGLVSMRLIDTVIALADIVRKRPALLLSISELLKAFKDGSNTGSNSGTGSDFTSMDAPRTTDKEADNKGE